MSPEADDAGADDVEQEAPQEADATDAPQETQDAQGAAGDGEPETEGTPDAREADAEPEDATDEAGEGQATDAAGSDEADAGDDDAEQGSDAGEGQAEPEDEGPSEEELAAQRDEARKERVMTQVLGLVVEAGFPMPKRKAQRVAGHYTFQVDGTVLSVNMILNKIRGDSWRTGADLRKAIDRAWGDIKATYLGE